MAIKRSDIVEHNNSNNAVVDSNFVRGGSRVVANLTELYALSTKIDQLKQNVTKVWVVSANTDYLLTDITNVGNSAGWKSILNDVSDAINQAIITESTIREAADDALTEAVLDLATEVEDLTDDVIDLKQEVEDLDSRKADNASGIIQTGQVAVDIDLLVTVTPYIIKVNTDIITTNAAPNNTVQLDPRNPSYTRIDIVYANIDGTYGKVTGEAGNTQVRPQLPPNTILLADLIIPNGYNLQMPVDVVPQPTVDFYKNTGGEINGPVTVRGGHDIHLRARSGSDDSGDIVFEDWEGTEVGRIWKPQDGVKKLYTRFDAEDDELTILHSGSVGEGLIYDPSTDEISVANVAPIRSALLTPAINTNEVRFLEIRGARSIEYVVADRLIYYPTGDGVTVDTTTGRVIFNNQFTTNQSKVWVYYRPKKVVPVVPGTGLPYTLPFLLS